MLSFESVMLILCCGVTSTSDYGTIFRSLERMYDPVANLNEAAGAGDLVEVIRLLDEGAHANEIEIDVKLH